VKDYEAVGYRLNEEIKKMQTDLIEVKKEVQAIITEMKKTRQAMEKRQGAGYFFHSKYLCLFIITHIDYTTLNDKA
jgi:hypothetical protein